MRQVQAVTTLRSGRIIEKNISKESPQVEEVSKDTTSKAEGEEKIIAEELKEKDLVHRPKAPFP